jgi:hypothetical protein
MGLCLATPLAFGLTIVLSLLADTTGFCSKWAASQYNTSMHRTRRNPHTEKIRHHFLNAIGVVSLLLLLAAVGLCTEILSLNTEFLGKGRRVLYLDKQIYIHFEGDMAEHIGLGTSGKSGTTDVDEDFDMVMFWYSSRTQNGVTVTYIYFSLYRYIVLLAIIFGLCLVNLIEGKKPVTNECNKCGHDLGSNETAKCPECGVKTVKSPPDSA